MEIRSDDYHSRTRLKYILYASGFLDLFGVSMVMPLILPHAQDIGASPTLAGIIGSVYGGIQLVSSPVVGKNWRLNNVRFILAHSFQYSNLTSIHKGKWSDKVGRHFSLLVCLFLTGCGYTILGLFSSLAVLFAGRFVLGCFKHSQTICKVFLAEIVPDHDRSALLGNFNSISTIGFVVGPIVGGHLAEISFSFAAFAAGLVFIGNAVLVWWATKYDTSSAHLTHQRMESTPSSPSVKKPISDEANFSFGQLAMLFRDFDWAELWDLFLIKFFAGFSVIIFRGNFTMVLKQKFEASPKTIGYMTSYSGAVATLSGFLIGKITDRYNSTAQLLLHVTILQVITLLCLTLSTSINLIVIFLAPLSIITSVSRVAGATLTISRSGNSKIGSIMGLGQSVLAVARMSAPFFAGVAQEFSVDGAAFISVVAATASVLILLLRPQDPKLRHKLLA